MRLPAFLALACLASCTAGGAPLSSPASGRVVDVRELPRANAELLEAYAKGGDAWEAARERAVADPALLRFLVDNLAVELVKAHRALGSGDTARARRARDRAQHELVRIGEPAVGTLVGLVEVADPVSATLAVDVLALIGRPSSVPTAALLDSTQPETRRRASAALAELPHAGVANEPAIRAKLVRLARTDGDWIVRAQCATALGARGAHDTDLEPWRVALQGLLDDEDAAVAEAAAKALVPLGDARAFPVLLRVLESSSKSGDLRRFQAVQSTLVALSGQPPKADLAGWRDWWERNRARIEGTKAR